MHTRRLAHSANSCLVLALTLSSAISVACTPTDQRASSTADSGAQAVQAPSSTNASTSVPPSHDTAMVGMANMPGMTNDPNHDFLRMMTNYHQGLIRMVHETIERKDKLRVKGEATALDHQQDQEMDKMMTMLEQQYKDPYTPTVTPENQAMINALTPLSGAAYDHKFLENVIAHQQAGIQMIDQFLPKLTDAKLKTMAETMKAGQQKDIARLQRELKS